MSSRPHGRALLFGHNLGALVAYEASGELARQRDLVGLVVRLPGTPRVGGSAVPSAEQAQLAHLR